MILYFKILITLNLTYCLLFFIREDESKPSDNWIAPYYIGIRSIGLSITSSFITFIVSKDLDISIKIYTIINIAFYTYDYIVFKITKSLREFKDIRFRYKTIQSAVHIYMLTMISYFIFSNIKK